MKNRNLKELLFYFIMILIMVMSLNLAIIDCTGMAMPIMDTALITFIITAVISIIVLFPFVILVLLLIGAGWLKYQYYTDPQVINAYVEAVREFYDWLYWYIAGYNHFDQAYSMTFLLIYIIIAVLVTAPVVYSGRGSFVLILAGTAASAFFWFVYVEKARRYLLLFLFASIMLYSYQIYKRRLKEWKAAGSCVEHDVGYYWMLCSAGIVSTSLLLSLTLPMNISPVRVPWLNDKVVSLFPFIAEWRNDSLESFSYGFNSRFSLNSAGYVSKKLGGELRLDDSVLMTVKTKEKDTLYLRGTVKEKYIQNGWYKSERSYKEYDQGESMALPYGEDVNTFETSLDITYKKLVTSTVFAPYSIYQVQHRSGRIYADEDSEVYTSKMTMKDEKYTVKSKLPYIDINRLRQAGTGGLGYGKLKAYTALASDIPQRVKTLAVELTRMHDNNYDKAKAIEEYLRRNYKYTRKPPKLPQKAEFADHFLFEGKEGYCTYFATAMSVLLRASGIPARYVEGFASVYQGTATREVRGSSAHAWVEVYFDNYGWVTFEPTPQYPEVEFVSAPAASDAADADEENASTAGDLDIGNIPRHSRELEERDLEIGGDLHLADQKQQLNIGKIILFMIFISLLARFTFMYLGLNLKEMRLARSAGRRYAMNYLENLIFYLRHAGFEMEKEETLREFLKRVIKYSKEDISDISMITSILEKTRYGDYEPDAEERQILEIFRKNVRQLAVKNTGIAKLFVRMYILGS
jgi:hypothetical protein